ncbi:efflux transporter outer membrane subunit [Fuscibacter oryzae]|uniref:Efflux transporter outer membrane subunit n=1 Tax=Fuscibacter oryzae TaxID=2803939 RepID=A0A8J7SU94_9RHOB|nr:efflux transporter outer membrane subunit [Fuscibacter oryzae]MBL4930066.1 efflux transporter outer membrane subunit [Fuscibacter oryzae]
MAPQRQARHPWGRPFAISALALATALAACAQKEDYKTPHFPFFGSYSQKQAAPVLLSNAEWWHGFQDPVLNQLVAQALAGNLSIAAARERVVQARAEARGVPDRAGLSASAAGRQQGEKGGDVTSSAEGDLGLSWMLDPYGERRARKAAAGARVEAADAETDAARLLVLYNLCNAYVELRYQQRLLALRQQEIASRRSTLSLAQSLFDTNSGTKLDVTRTQAELAQAQADLPLIEAAIRVQQNQIAVLTGRQPGTSGPEREPGKGMPQARMSADIGIPADLLRNRPDIRIAERLYYAAVNQVDVARAALYPRLSLSGAINLTSVRKGGSSRDYYFGPSVSLPEFPNSSTKAGVEATYSAARQAHIDWKATVLNAVMEVENALVEYDGSRRARAATERSLTLYRQAQTMTRDLVQSGGATVGDLIDADQSVTNASNTLAQTQRQQALDFIALNVRLGSGSAAGEAPAPATPPGN